MTVPHVARAPSSPLRRRVQHGPPGHPARRLATRVTLLGAAALAAGWYLGPEDGFAPAVALAGIGLVLGWLRAREVWRRRTVGRRIRAQVGETPVSLGS